MLSAPCYPAWQIFAGKSTEIFAPPLHNPTAQGRIKAGALGISKGKSLDAAAIKISVGFYKKGCKPFSYALVFIVFIGCHAFAALRLVTFLSRKR